MFNSVIFRVFLSNRHKPNVLHSGLQEMAGVWSVCVRACLCVCIVWICVSVFLYVCVCLFIWKYSFLSLVQQL